IDGFKAAPLKGANALFDITVTYEAYHSHLWCQSAQWPIEWKGDVAQGTPAVPNQVLVVATRVPGGDSNGSYIKYTNILLELTRASATETSLHMRYEIAAPSQAASDALGAITEYIDRASLVAAGGKAPGATPDPQCPYSK